MSEVVERVAKAIWEVEEAWHNSDDIEPPYERMARAAIEAMREPTLQGDPGMSETIPDAIMAEARAIVSDIDADFSFDGQASRAEEAEGKDEAVSSIAQAILAAERRGTERERDRCAKIADDDSAHCRKRGAEVERSAYEGTWLCCADTGELIASAIREGAS